jgi:uncharacterized protein YcbK (DUF882 family)
MSGLVGILGDYGSDSEEETTSSPEISAEQHEKVEVVSETVEMSVDADNESSPNPRINMDDRLPYLNDLPPEINQDDPSKINPSLRELLESVRQQRPNERFDVIQVPCLTWLAPILYNSRLLFCCRI